MIWIKKIWEFVVKYHHIIYLVLIGFLIVMIMRDCSAYKKLREDYFTAENNIKAYEQENSNLKKDNYQFKLTVDKLETSNDTLLQAMDSVRKLLKIKDKNLTQVQYVRYEVKITDTLTVNDTIFIDKDFKLDTTISDKWHSTRILMKYPSFIYIEPSLESEKYAVFSFEKVTVKPPKKFFIARWFQKKQKVVKVDIVETNPYVVNKNQRYVEVVK